MLLHFYPRIIVMTYLIIFLLLWFILLVFVLRWASKSKPQCYVEKKYNHDFKIVFFLSLPFCASWEKHVDVEDIPAIQKYRKRGLICVAIGLAPYFGICLGMGIHYYFF